MYDAPHLLPAGKNLLPAIVVAVHLLVQHQVAFKTQLKLRSRTLERGKKIGMLLYFSVVYGNDVLYNDFVSLCEEDTLVD